MAEAPAEVNEINEISAETGMTSAMPVSLYYESNPVTQAVSKAAFSSGTALPGTAHYSGIPSGAATSGAAPSPGIPSGAAPSPGIPSGGTSPGIPPSWGMPSTTGSVPGK